MTGNSFVALGLHLNWSLLKMLLRSLNSYLSATYGTEELFVKILILIVSYLKKNKHVVLVFPYLDDLCVRDNFSHRIKKK